MSRVWGELFALAYDRAMEATEAAGLGEQRRRLLAEAQGEVIEIGAGTGANLAHYPGATRRLVLLEPEPPMARRLRQRAAAGRPGTEVVSAPAEALRFADDTFDTAVCTLVLCTVTDPVRALAELRRVLRPEGRLLFLEHVRAEDPSRARWQDRLDPVWRRWAHGCRCNRPTAATITAAGFTMERCEPGRVPKAPAIVRPLIAGVARPGGG